jgi:hypothetical protein
LRDGLVAAHTAQDRSGGDGQNHRQRMASSLGAARIGEIGKELG